MADVADQPSSNNHGGAAVERLFTDEQHKSFQNDGYLHVSGFFHAKDVEELVAAGDATVRNANSAGAQIFSTNEAGIIFGPRSKRGGSSSRDLEWDAPEIVRAFRKIALRSNLGKASAELMQLDPSTQNVRILRDVFLAKRVQAERICDWHVDDQSYWPECYTSSASESSGKDQYGINVWIAMDDMPAEYGGSMALAKNSHKAVWRHAGYRAIGQDRTVDKGASEAEMTKKYSRAGSSPNGTCNLHVSDPDLRKKIEESKQVLDLRRGDVIFATRLLFHRTMDISKEGKEYFASIGKTTLNRFTIRYVPGTARLPKGFSDEESILSNKDNRGRTLDEVAEQDGALWYPKVWPTVDSDVDAKLDDLAQTRMAVARDSKAAWLSEIRRIASQENLGYYFNSIK